MSTFKQKVGKSKKAMIQFLTNHFRYDTMSSWNQSTSYANKVKIHSVIPNNLRTKVYELMETEEFYDNLSEIISDFGMEHDQKWQAGFNGRSSGYIVLYSGEKNTKTIFNFENCERDYADGYGWLSISEAKERGLYKKQITKVSTFPGRSIDMGEDFEDWSIDDLKERVKLVCEFDEMCDNVVAEAIRMANENEVVEEVYTVEKKRKVMA